MTINFNAANAFDFESTVLPDTDACQKIEAQAIKDAQTEFKKRPKIYLQELDEADLFEVDEYREDGYDLEDESSKRNSKGAGFLSKAKIPAANTAKGDMARFLTL